MASSFNSNDKLVREILESIAKGENQLPDFQRGWVWDDTHIKALIASISNSYPVGAVMFLENGGDSVRFKHRAFEGVELEADVKPERLVLDGQQRLTSVFSAMYSLKPVNTVTEKKQDVERFYYLDIQKCLDDDIDRPEAILSIPSDRMIKKIFGREIEIDLSSRDKEFKNRMFPLNIVYDHNACSDWRNEYQEYYDYDKDVTKRFTQFENSILRSIQDYKVPVITLDKSTPKEAVCQVFENVNTGGVSLTVFELVTASFAADDFNLRDDWEKRSVDFINRSALSASNLNQAILSVVSSTDFLTALTLVARFYSHENDGPAVSCKRKDVLNLTLNEYTTYADRLSEGFIKTASLLKEQRIFSERDLPYSTQLIPMAAVFTLLGKNSNDSTVKSKITRWYWCGVFGEMYGGANETRYALDVTGLIELSWLKNTKATRGTIGNGKGGSNE